VGRGHAPGGSTGAEPAGTERFPGVPGATLSGRHGAGRWFPATPDDVLDLVDAPVDGAAVGAALELGLFWLLEPRPLEVDAVASALGMPARRCERWLDVLGQAGLVERGPSGCSPTAAARATILGSYSRETWALLAEEARERLATLADLPARLRAPAPGPAAAPSIQPYVARMAADPDRARRFTRMLAEVHRPLAAALAEQIDLAGVGRLMDLGGGSGVVSMALAERWPDLAVTVVDVPTVCAAGRELVAERGLGGRIGFWPADFVHDRLPAGFDAVLECDVDVYGEELFGRIRDSLDAGGRYLIVDALDPDVGSAERLRWAFQRSLAGADDVPATPGTIADQLRAARFAVVASGPLPPLPGPSREIGDGGLWLIEARA